MTCSPLPNALWTFFFCGVHATARWVASAWELQVGNAKCCGHICQICMAQWHQSTLKSTPAEHWKLPAGTYRVFSVMKTSLCLTLGFPKWGGSLLLTTATEWQITWGDMVIMSVLTGRHKKCDKCCTEDNIQGFSFSMIPLIPWSHKISWNMRFWMEFQGNPQFLKNSMRNRSASLVLWHFWRL